ncbi:hypothetical protein PVAND_016734 [Polypedilum vanderplanki]|uniref:Uncharacterized protein n=1 Tax=Polypedilum vanderplanki TaxID=319348 RepID=A0A9J6BGI2_POLVA|nr:hypothetical protein PVAND_016734 [Polypedilum vanderplanki]
MFLKVFIVILTLQSFVYSIELNCKSFITSNWWTQSLYECENGNIQITSKTKRTITKINASHNHRKSNKDVDSVWIHDTIVNFFPKNLEEFFPDLIAISITTSKLKEIHADDLKPFPKLIKLFLTNNELEVLDEDLFANNPKLKRLNFDGNRIRHVGGSLFVGHENLLFLHFLNNNCYSGEAKDDRFEVMMLALNIQNDCFDVKYEASKRN